MTTHKHPGYVIKEIFYTLQGEGFHAGTPALFIRFAGCNMWSGQDIHRERDAQRNDAECPLWCDTNFYGGKRVQLNELPACIAKTLSCGVGGAEWLPLIVLTGGEPLLQVDSELLLLLRDLAPKAILAVETNGSVLPTMPVGTRGGLDWVCVSPKLPLDRLALRSGDELKVVYPAYDPLDYAPLHRTFKHCYVSAQADTVVVPGRKGSPSGMSMLSSTNLQAAAAFVMAHPRWKLTLQGHKVIQIP